MFRGYTTREPASIVYDDEQVDLVYSAGPHRILHDPQLTLEKLRRDSGKSKGEWTGNVEFRNEEIPGSTFGMENATNNS